MAKGWVCVRHVPLCVMVMVAIVSSAAGNADGGWVVRKGSGAKVAGIDDGQLAALRLRGGSAAAPRPAIKVLRSNSGIKQEHAKARPQQTPPPAGSIFTKVALKSKEAKGANKVQVVGSWSSFKDRAEMKKLPNGDWELIVELPKGRHECKFVLNEKDWICSNDMDVTQDGHGNRNNVLVVEDSGRRAAAKATGGKALGGNAAGGDDKVFVKDSSGIDSARDVFQRLLEEEGKASERLKRAQAQLVETLSLELRAGLDTLTHCNTHVASFTTRGEQGMSALKANAAAKRAEIKAHVDAIRAVMAQKEAAAVELVEATCSTRVARLQAQVTVCDKAGPEVATLVDKVKAELANCPKNPSGFVDGSQLLIPQMEALSIRVMNTPRPLVEDDFENLVADTAKEEKAISQM